MLEPILQGLRDVEGVQGALIVDHAAQLIAHRAHSIYDAAVLHQVARAVTSAIDSVQLIQDDWELVTTHFGDGKLLLRSLRVAGARPRRYVLAVIADGSLNVAFLGVALRVAAGKLISELETMSPGLASGSTGRLPVTDPARELARSGLSWSGVSAGSGVGASQTGEIGVADQASSAFLSACTKALAASIGPMAKVFVKEAVRRVCGERAFTRADGPAVLAQLAAAIDDTDDRAMFQRATRSL